MLCERTIIRKTRDMAAPLTLPYEHSSSKTHHLVLEVEDMLRIRARIAELYFNQKVFVAPCLSKLYLSTDSKVIEDTNKYTPEWLYFGIGVVTIIYDTTRNEVKLALFDKNDVRLLWCMKWTEHVVIEKVSGIFHVINHTESGVGVGAGEMHHVGVLYENDDVADVIAQTVTLIYSSVQMTLDDEKQNSRTTIPTHVQTSWECDHNKNKNSIKDKVHSRPLPETRGVRSATVHEVYGIAQRKVLQSSLDERPKSDCPDSRLLRLSRADSFKKMRSKSLLVDNGGATADEKGKHARKGKGEESNKLKDTILKALFKKRRITRTQSLKVEDESSQQSGPDSKQFERAVKLSKPRASTDTELLKGDSMRFVIETGMSARTERERRNWLKQLRNEQTPSTDLCVTEL